MNLISCTAVAGCLSLASFLTAQSTLDSSHSVSVYQLRHKPMRAARHLCDEATVELERHNYQTGLNKLRGALALDPDYWMAQNNLGYAYLHLQERQNAKTAFQRAIAIDPMNALAYTNLSVAALSLDDFLLAEESASQAIRLDPRPPQPKALLGLALVGQGRWTPVARKLLEQSRSVSSSEELLKTWPRGESLGPTVIIGTKGFR